jgi:hypothetical protein
MCTFFCRARRLLIRFVGDTAGRAERVLIHERRSALGSGELGLLVVNFVSSARSFPLMPGPNSTPETETTREHKEKKNRTEEK